MNPHFAPHKAALHLAIPFIGSMRAAALCISQIFDKAIYTTKKSLMSMNPRWGLVSFSMGSWFKWRVSPHVWQLKHQIGCVMIPNLNYKEGAEKNEYSRR